MARFVLDTNILIQIVRGNAIATEVNNYLQSQENPEIFISIVTKAEAESLVTQWNWPEQKVKVLSSLLDNLITIDISLAQLELIENYVAIDAYSQGKKSAPTGGKLSLSSRNMGKNDLWIAATALALNAELITMDGDFDHLNGPWIKVKKFFR
jgi:tRNA(fMet)-specific endonuclease VapC